MSADDWTNNEVDLCVGEYFKHLKLDISGARFNKAALYRELATKIPRTASSIEFKFQNISAVLDELGLEWINGLAPLNKYQKDLAIAVERKLPEFLSMGLEVNNDGLHDFAGLYVEAPPERSNISRQLPDYMVRLVKKFDPVLRDERNRALGESGERFALEYEKRLLKAHQREDLAKKIRWVSKEDGDGAGFDILSFEPDGTEKFIEVKTTNGGNKTPFFLSRNENEFSKESGDRFHLFRLFDFRRNPRAFELIGRLDQYVRLSPEIYRADFEARIPS